MTAILRSANNTSAARLGAIEERSSQLARSDQFARILQTWTGRHLKGRPVPQADFGPAWTGVLPAAHEVKAVLCI